MWSILRWQKRACSSIRMKCVKQCTRNTGSSKKIMGTKIIRKIAPPISGCNISPWFISTPWIWVMFESNVKLTMEVPPPFAILQASRGAKRRSTAWQEEPGGGWRSAGIWGEFLGKWEFSFESVNFLSLVRCGLAGTPRYQFSAELNGRREFQMKVKVLSSVLVLLL